MDRATKKKPRADNCWVQNGLFFFERFPLGAPYTATAARRRLNRALDAIIAAKTIPAVENAQHIVHCLYDQVRVTALEWVGKYADAVGCAGCAKGVSPTQVLCRSSRYIDKVDLLATLLTRFCDLIDLPQPEDSQHPAETPSVDLEAPDLTDKQSCSTESVSEETV